jgi:hypothetical protein
VFHLPAPERCKPTTTTTADAATQSGLQADSPSHNALARAALTNHDLDAAAAAATTTVELAVTVRSSRSLEAVFDLRRRLRGHESSPAVADFFELAEVFLPTS